MNSFGWLFMVSIFILVVNTFTVVSRSAVISQLRDWDNRNVKYNVLVNSRFPLRSFVCGIEYYRSARDKRIGTFVEPSKGMHWGIVYQLNCPFLEESVYCPYHVFRLENIVVILLFPLEEIIKSKLQKIILCHPIILKPHIYESSAESRSHVASWSSTCMFHV